MPKTREQIENLKENWLNAPCWDISDTDGYEDHYDELKAFEDAQNAKWESQAQDRKEQAIKQLKEKHGDNIWDYVYYLEQKLDDYYTLKKQVEIIVGQCQNANIMTNEDKII